MRNDNKRSFMSFNSRDFKGFTFRSGPVKNQVKQNSTFWDTNSNDESYTDGKKVVIGANIDDKKFDVAVGPVSYTHLTLPTILLV